MVRRATVSVRNAVRKLHPYLLQAREQNMNEADTVRRISKVFEDALGYDPLTEVSREAQSKGKYLDLLMKIDDVPRLIVEVKRAGVKLRDRHIEQSYYYASTSNLPWVLLTNGVEWNLYHLTFEEGIEYEKAFSVDLSRDDINEVGDKLSLLHRDFIKKGGLEEWWEKQIAMQWPSIARALFHDEVLSRIRREIRRDAGVLIDPEDLAERLYQMFSQEVREEIGQPRIRRRRRSRQAREKELPDSSATSEVQKACHTADEPPR
jgi:hypothetical protein